MFQWAWKLFTITFKQLDNKLFTFYDEWLSQIRGKEKVIIELIEIQKKS